MSKFLTGSTRQLTDLSIGPSKTDARPLFDLGHVPHDYPGYGDVPPYRVLRWHPVTLDEVCATSPEHLARVESEGYVRYEALNHVAPNKADEARDLLEGLTADERQMVAETQRASRLAAINAKLSALSDAQLASVLGDPVPVRRGPGRPRKTEN